MVTTRQRDLMRAIEKFVAEHYPGTAVQETATVDGSVSAHVLGKDVAERDQAVDDLAALLHLGEAGVSADGRIYCASHHGVAVWTSQEGVG